MTAVRRRRAERVLALCLICRPCGSSEKIHKAFPRNYIGCFGWTNSNTCPRSVYTIAERRFNSQQNALLSHRRHLPDRRGRKGSERSLWDASVMQLILSIVAHYACSTEAARAISFLTGCDLYISFDSKCSSAFC